MKTILAAVLLLNLAHATEVRVSRMNRILSMDRQFVLKTNVPEKVVLDCQSFIQGLHVGADANFILDPDECEGLYLRIRESHKRFQKHCLEIEEDIRADYSCN